MTDASTEALSLHPDLLDYYRARSHPKNLAEYTKILDETTQQTLPFSLWDWQPLLLDTWMQKKYVVVLKARQLGVSWLLALYALWTAIFFPNSNVLLLSKGEKEAKALLGKCKTLYRFLPKHLRPPLVRTNDSVMEWGFEWDDDLASYKHFSKITALPATEDAGRSETATIVIADEHAYHPYAEKNFAAIQPTIDAGNAKFISVSTANGSGNFFALIYKGAQQEHNEGRFWRVFLPYSLRPGRNKRWYQDTQGAYKASPTIFHQEFPRDEEEAFIASGGCIFDLESLRDLERGCVPPLPIESLGETPLAQLAEQHDVNIWKPYNPAHAYAMWTDCATSIHGRDYFCTRVMDVDTKEDVASYHIKTDEYTVGRVTYELGRAYGWAYWGVERTGVGELLLSLMLNVFGYPRDRVYHHKDPNVRGDLALQSKSPGWPASRSGNEKLQSIVRNAIAFREVTTWDRDLVLELKTYVEDPETHKVEAKPPDYDDRADAFIGCLYLADLPEAHVRVKRPQMPAKPKSRLAGRRGVIV